MGQAASPIRLSQMLVLRVPVRLAVSVVGFASGSSGVINCVSYCSPNRSLKSLARLVSSSCHSRVGQTATVCHSLPVFGVLFRLDLPVSCFQVARLVSSKFKYQLVQLEVCWEHHSDGGFLWLVFVSVNPPGQEKL